MENKFKLPEKQENKNTDKNYIYHMVPVDENGKENMEGNFLLPLNELKKKNLELYLKKVSKYESNDLKRKNIPELNVPMLDGVKWGDVVQLSAIHPRDIEAELIHAYKKAGLDDHIQNIKEMKFYQIDPDIFSDKNTAVYLYKDAEDKSISDEDVKNYEIFNKQNLAKHAIFPEITKEHYKQMLSKKERPYLFVGVPHVFHNGSIDISNAPVITIFEKTK